VAHLIVRHTVQDFAKWKPVYDAHRSSRQAAGLKDLFLWHNADKPNELVLLFEVSDVTKAKAFTMSSDLKDKMAAAGVVGPPDIVFLSAA
jgi:hypothetical protein